MHPVIREVDEVWVCVLQGGAYGCVRVGCASVRPKKINKSGGAGRGDFATQQQHLRD